MIVEDPRQWKQFVLMDASGRCAMEGEGECDEGREAHHVITQQALRKRGFAELKWDTWNGLCLCCRHHARHTKAVQRVMYERLRPKNIAFANSLELGWMLERYYPKEGT